MTDKTTEGAGLLPDCMMPDGADPCKAYQYLRSQLEAVTRANERVGKWLSAALDDPSVCKEMKADVQSWFYSQAIREGEK